MAPPRRYRGGGSQRGKLRRVNGADVPYDPDDIFDDKDRPRPTPLFPDFFPTPPSPLKSTEKRQLNHLLAFRSAVHASPCYTVLDEVKLGKSKVERDKEKREQLELRRRGGVRKEKVVDPFRGGGGRYSSRYVQHKDGGIGGGRGAGVSKGGRAGLKSLSYRKYDLEMFPRLFWGFLDPGFEDPLHPRPKKIMQKEEREKERKGWMQVELEPEEEFEIGEGGEILGRKGEVGGKDGEMGKEGGEEDEGDEDEVVDDEFEDEEEGGDYDAEQYFDDGDDDGGGEGFEAGGEGSGYFE